MTPEPLRLLLDEHYPFLLAESLCEAGVDTVAVQRTELLGHDDATVLSAAVADRRVVVTEDITTFAIAVERVPAHLGVIFVHPRRYPRTKSGLARLHEALVELSESPPSGLGRHPVVYWIA